MPITTQFNGEIIDIRMTGIVTGDEMHVHLDDVREIESRESVTPNRLINLGVASTDDIRFNEVSSVAERRRGHKLRNPIKSAIVAVTPLQFGLARTFQALNENPQIEVRVFRDEPAARAWLAELGRGETPFVRLPSSV